MLRYFTRLFRSLFRPSVTVAVSKRRPTDYDARKEATTRKLAQELGRQWPVKGGA